MSQAYFKNLNSLKGPIFSVLKKEGYQAVDMHYHSKFSVDGLAKVRQIMNKCRQEQFGVAFTDHNQIGGILKKSSIPKDIFVVSGMEITCHSGVHVLLHFYSASELQDFYAREMRKIVLKNPWFISLNHEEVIDLASRYNCLISAPHPFGPGLIGIKRYRIKEGTLRKIGAIEAINGCCLREMNEKALAWGKKANKGFVGGSDGHCLAELGTVITLCKADTIEEFLNQIQKRQSVVIGSEEKLLEDAIHAFGKFVREEEKAPPKQLETMWKDRGLMELGSLKQKLMESDFWHHFHSHHRKITAEAAKKHRHTKHLVKYL